MMDGLMGDSMDLLSLRFIPVDLEGLFHSKKRNLAIDKSICLFKLGVTVLLLASYAVGLAAITSAAVASWLAYLAVLVLQTWLLTQHPEFYSSNRHWLAVCIKVALACCLLTLIPTSVLQPIDTTGAYVKVLLLGSGVVALNCTGIFVPVLWRHHLPLSLAMLLLFSCVLPAAADTLLCSPLSRQLTRRLFHSVDAAAQQFSSLLLPLPAAVAAAGANHPAAAESLSQAEAAARAEAYTLLLWLQLFVGLLVPGVWTYLQEARSRASFLLQLSRTTHNTPPANPDTGAGGSISGPTSSGGAPAAQPTPTASALLSDPGVATVMLPHQPLLLVSALLVLTAVVLWQVLALTAGQLAPAIDRHVWGGSWVQQAAAPAFGAGACVQSMP